MLSSSGRSTDSMQISLGLSREAKVQNRFDVGDIEPSRNDISGYQIIHSSHLEIFHRLEAICLFQVTVYLGAFEPKDGKKRVETGALNLLIGEYDDPLCLSNSCPTNHEEAGAAPIGSHLWNAQHRGRCD